MTVIKNNGTEGNRNKAVRNKCAISMLYEESCIQKSERRHIEPGTFAIGVS